MSRMVDLVGQKFDRLTVLKRVGSRYSHHIWQCKCDCGELKEISGISLKKGLSRSCGCLAREGNNKSHGLAKTRQYKIWANMLKRCNNPKGNRYYIYGGKGIKVCDNWLKFESFWNDMKKGYSDNLSIDRINNNGNYEKNNCRWATKYEQMNNRSNSVFVTYNNETKTLSQWARKIGMNYDLLRLRIFTYKWPIEEAFTISPDVWHKGNRL